MVTVVNEFLSSTSFFCMVTTKSTGDVLYSTECYKTLLSFVIATPDSATASIFSKESFVKNITLVAKIKNDRFNKVKKNANMHPSNDNFINFHYRQMWAVILGLMLHGLGMGSQLVASFSDALGTAM